MEEVEAQAVAAGAEAPAGAASVSGLTQEAWQAISVIPSAPAAMATEATAAATGSTTAAAVPARKRPAEVIADDTERASRDAEVAVEPGGTKRRDDVGDDSARREDRNDGMSSIEDEAKTCLSRNHGQEVKQFLSRQHGPFEEIQEETTEVNTCDDHMDFFSTSHARLPGPIHRRWRAYTGESPGVRQRAEHLTSASPTALRRTYYIGSFDTQMTFECRLPFREHRRCSQRLKRTCRKYIHSRGLHNKRHCKACDQDGVMI